jgi:hypothetical protein
MARVLGRGDFVGKRAVNQSLPLRRSECIAGTGGGLSEDRRHRKKQEEGDVSLHIP